MRPEARYDDATTFPLSMYLKIGLFQCLAMIPGVSRSGATIVGAMVLGADKRSAAEFSFFLAMPTMAGAFAYDLFKNYKMLDPHDFAIIGVGLCGGIRVRALRREGASDLRVEARLLHLRMVADHRRVGGPGRSLGAGLKLG